MASRRQDLGLTQAELRDRLERGGVDVSHATVSAWEWGRPRMAVDQLIGLAGALECSVTYLLGLTAKPDKWTPDR
jgi:transcriptional regulator with XRE-family HTH domain